MNPTGVSQAEVTILGCGTSAGVPVIGCTCSTCASTDPRNDRTRCSALLQFTDDEGTPRAILIDSSSDFRQQALREKIPRIDAVLYTHAHADHIFGLDDLRIFNFRQGGSIPCYGSTETLGLIRRTFAYVFEDGQEGGGKPKLTLHPISEAFDLLGLRVVPIPVLHGRLEVFGFRLGTFAYVTDCSEVPPESMEKLAGVEQLVLGALRYSVHPTHFNFEEAGEVVDQLKPEKTWFTHLACDVDSTEEQPLAPGVSLAHDGLKISARFAPATGEKRLDST